MKLFYTASFLGKEKYQVYYDRVLDAINKCDVDIISPELGGYELVLSNDERRRLDDQRLIHYEAIRKGILISDAVIIEVSNEDFQLGHEASIAINSKKPVLCLSVNEDFSRKIKNPYFFGAKYNMFDVDEVVKAFVENARKEVLSERFNFFLSPRQLQHLEKASQELLFNKSEYLRRLIENDMKSK